MRSPNAPPTSATRYTCIVNHPDLSHGGIVFLMSFPHLLSIVLSKSWSQVAFMLDTTCQDCRSGSCVGCSSSSSGGYAERRIFWSFGYYNLIFDTVVDHIQFIAVGLWACCRIFGGGVENRLVEVVSFHWDLQQHVLGLRSVNHCCFSALQIDDRSKRNFGI